MEKLSIIIPVYNEAKTIRDVIEKVKNVKLKEASKELIIVDDFSGDGTRDILKRIRDSRIKILLHPRNMGKGTAIRTGLEKATGGIILIQDADLEYDPSEYPRLLAPIIKGEADVVYGSRLQAIKKNLNKMYKLHYLGNLLLTFMTNALYGAKITDMETGYKVIKREVLKKIILKSKRFDFEPEITAKILKNGYKIHEVPIKFFGRKFDEGKKITWVDGLKAAFYLVKYRFLN
ncbi:glycosyltransferase family 2 protein [Candidatus Woesearchaeota archaeon]|nr:glycosyltransferase family 2 protein [Candidatus Woesearchaeota archaeon]